MSDILNINTVKELALQLGCPEGHILDIGEHLSDHYVVRPRLIGKKMRDLHMADISLSLVLSKIDKKLLNKIDFPLSIQGGIKKRSIVSNANIHKNKRFVASYDIQNFFPSVSHKCVYKSFIALKCAPDVARILTRLVTAEGALPQGFATSPKISGIILLDVNLRIEKLLNKYEISHSFWIDDLTLSSNQKIEGLEKIIRKIFIQSGFVLHDQSKTKYASSSEQQICTKLVINKSPNITSDKRKKLEAELYCCKKFGIKQFLYEHNITIDEESYLKSLKGRVSFACSLNESNAKLRDMLKTIKVEKPVS